MICWFVMLIIYPFDGVFFWGVSLRSIRSQFSTWFMCVYMCWFEIGVKCMCARRCQKRCCVGLNVDHFCYHYVCIVSMLVLLCAWSMHWVHYLRSLYIKYVFIDSGNCNWCTQFVKRFRPIFCRMTRLQRSISGSGSADE